MTLFMIIVSVLFGLVSKDFRMTLITFIGFFPLIFLDISNRVLEYRAQKYLNWLCDQYRKEKEEKKGGSPDADN